VVEDSFTTRRLIMRALDQTGLADFAYTEAEDGVDALAKFRAGETEIVFVDMNMPRMNGIEFVRELHAQYRKCPPTVMITAEAGKDRLLEAISEAGVDAFMLKPVNRDRLFSGLKTLVDSIPARGAACAVPYAEYVPAAVREIVGEACHIELSLAPLEKPVLEGESCIGLLSLHGSIHWSVAVGFARSAAEAVASKFAGCDVSSNEADLGDAIAEITNMVGGRTKQHLASKGLGVNVSLPTVIGASGFRVLLQRKNTAAYARLESSVGTIFTMVILGIQGGMVL